MANSGHGAEEVLEVAGQRADGHHVEWRDLDDLLGPGGPTVSSGWTVEAAGGWGGLAGRRPMDGIDGGWPRSVVCPGTLVVHVDGTAAACSEELDGRCCSGAGVAHRQQVSCRDLLGLGGCETCGAEDDGLADDPFVRHAVRVAVLAARHPRCRTHRHRAAP